MHELSNFSRQPGNNYASLIRKCNWLGCESRLQRGRNYANNAIECHPNIANRCTIVWRKEKKKQKQKSKLWAKWDLVATAVDREMQ